MNPTQWEPPGGSSTLSGVCCEWVGHLQQAGTHMEKERISSDIPQKPASQSSFPASASPAGSSLTTQAHLQLVLVLLVDPGQQLGFPSVEGVNEGVTLGHQAGFKLHTVLLWGTEGVTAQGASPVQLENWIFLFNGATWGVFACAAAPLPPTDPEQGMWDP